MPASRGLELRLRLTARGWFALGLGAALIVAGVVLGYPGVLAFGAGLVLLTIVSVVAVLTPAAVHPEQRVTPVRVMRNGRCTAALRVRSAGARFAIDLDAAERIGDRWVPVVVPRLRPGQVVQVALDIPTLRRGRVDVGPLRLRRVGTAGLAVATGEIGEPVTVHVLPRTLPVLGMPAGARRGHVGADERIERGGTDLVGLREYVAGDDLRRVHGPTSARTGTLMVREDADPARPRLTVLLDDRTDAYVSDLFEDAVEVAASLITEMIDSGHAVRLVSTSGQLDDELPAAPPGMLAPEAGRLLAALAEVVTVDARHTADPVALRDLDVAVAITGPAGDTPAMAAEVGRAMFATVAVLDERASGVDVLGEALVLRGPTAEDVLHSWDVAVAR